MTADEFWQHLTARGSNPRKTPSGWTAKCPAHEDRTASLSIGTGHDGRILLRCHAGCGTESIVSALGLKMADLFPTLPPKPVRSRIVKAYDYTDEAGMLLFQCVRFEPKSFRQRRPDPAKPDEWDWNLRGVRRVLYRLPELQAALAARRAVFVAEGEKDCDALAIAGFVATCNPMGAGKWLPEHAETLRGARRVVVIADKDAANPASGIRTGLAHAQAVAQSLHGHVGGVKLIELPDRDGHRVKDAADWFAAGGTEGELKEIVRAAAEFVPDAEDAALKSAAPVVGFADPSPDLSEDDEEPLPQAKAWPEPPAAAAFHGLAGDVVRLIEPHSESDPMAVLMMFLSAFGNMVGAGPHFTAEARKHPARVWPVLVGETAKGRKGSAWSSLRFVLEKVDAHWLAHCAKSGLSSGEGLIWAVRDPIVRQKCKGGVSEEIMEDEGVSDKRLLTVEEEFGAVLKVAERQGNTVSDLLRRAWDDGSLATMTKNSPAKATGAHVSVIGHITKADLLRLLSQSYALNGFGNRFLWVAVKRSKMLPEGGALHRQEMAALIRRLKEALDFARKTTLLERTEAATTLWRGIYPQLSAGGVGLTGALTNRGDPQTMRLALLFALLDCRDEIDVPHLRAALAVWDYCERSARYIFGDSLGDKIADRILDELRAKQKRGLTKEEIRTLFNGNTSALKINAALAELSRLGLAHSTKHARQGQGRPVTIWRASPDVKNVVNVESPTSAGITTFSKFITSGVQAKNVRSEAKPPHERDDLKGAELVEELV